jgi:hypothetical protein
MGVAVRVFILVTFRTFMTHYTTAASRPLSSAARAELY